MYLADYHVHSAWSPDGKHSIEELAARAVEIGLDELCITDHVDTYYWKGFTPRDDFPWRAAAMWTEPMQKSKGGASARIFSILSNDQ